MTPSSPAEIDRFLSETRFSGYQSVPLPHGREIPGRDRSTAITQLLGRVGVEGKTVLDIGTYYGALPAAARKLGAIPTGLELDADRYQIAARAAELAGDEWAVRSGSVVDLGQDERFDVVFLLNVIHHIDDPIVFLQQVAEHCNETLVVEFPMAHDISAIRYFWDNIENSGSRPTTLIALRTYFWSLVLKAASRRLAVSLVGQHPYHRRWHFSIEAFRIITEQMVDRVRRVTIERSVWNRYRALATIELSPI